MKALQGLGPWPIVVAIAMLAGLVLLRVWRVRRRRRLAVLREVQRLQREFAIRDAQESSEEPQI